MVLYNMSVAGVRVVEFGTYVLLPMFLVFQRVISQASQPTATKLSRIAKIMTAFSWKG